MIEAGRAAPEGALVGVDVGGTFTDAAVVHAGRLVTAKLPTTPDDQSEAAVAAVLAALERAGLGPGDVAGFRHGMTVGTNALLEGKGARTSLVATEGFGDLLELRRQNRAHLYRLDAHHPPPLVPHERSHEVRERCGPEGVVTPLDPASVERVVDAVRADGGESVALGLLFSFAHPEHERQVARALRAALPGVHVSASHEVLPEIREYERLSTTAVDAYLTPVLRAYLRRLATRAADAGLPAPAIMQSSGGVLPIEVAAEHAAWTVLSGPAGGVIGAAHLAARERPPPGADLRHGRHLLRRRPRARRRPGADGPHGHRRPPPAPADAGRCHGLGRRRQRGLGRLRRRAAGGARVGGRRAPARPPTAWAATGPRSPTRTWCWGAFPPTPRWAERSAWTPRRRGRRWVGWPRAWGCPLEGCALGIVEVAVQEMVRALRLVSVERGEDAREATLIAFGGAGPLHACPVADELGMTRIVAPPAAGVLAALGLVVAGERRDHVQTVLVRVGGGTPLGPLLSPLAERARAELPGAAHRASADCRYVGQSHSLTIDWDPERPDEELAAAFHEAHRARFGDADPGRPVEAVTLRLAAELPGSPPDLPTGEPGEPVRGPAVIPMEGATCWVGEGWTARTDAVGAIVMERHG